MREEGQIATKVPHRKMPRHLAQTQPIVSSYARDQVVGQVLRLQRTLGNRTMQKLLKSEVLQGKLQIGRPNDIYGQKSARVAEQVVRFSSPAVDTPVVQRLCAESGEEMQRQPAEVEELIQANTLDHTANFALERQREDEEEELLQAKGGAGNTSVVTPIVASEIASMQGGRKPLPALERAFFAPPSGHELSQVLTHTGSQAAESAHAVQARAYTIGRDVGFGAGEYAPRTKLGKLLLARKLTHTVQQDAAGKPDAEAAESVLQRSEEEGGAVKSAGGGTTIIIVSGGFDQNGSDEQEAELLHSANRIRWSPGTKDFERTAKDTQTSNIYGAKIDDDFFGALQQMAGPFGRIVFIGHGGSGALGFSPSGASLNADSVSRWEASIDQQIKPKLTSDATIDLFSCEAGGDVGIMNALAAAFGVCVRGYAAALNWCIYSPPDSKVITSRGRWIEGSVDGADPDCEAPEWNKGVASAVPPVKVCP